MDNLLRYQVDHPEAQRLADVAGIKQDLKEVVKSAELFLSSPNDGSETAILTSNAIATFAIVTYFRTLASAVRSGVSIDQIRRLPAELQRVHERMKSIRDHYLAHSINNQEENAVEVTFDTNGMSIKTLGTSHSRPATFSYSEISSLKKLAKNLISILEEEYRCELDRVWEFVESLPESDRDLYVVNKNPVAYSEHWRKKRRKLGF